MHLIRHGLKDRRKANTADCSQRVLAAEFSGVEATFTAYVKRAQCCAA